MCGFSFLCRPPCPPLVSCLHPCLLPKPVLNGGPGSCHSGWAWWGRGARTSRSLWSELPCMGGAHCRWTLVLWGPEFIEPLWGGGSSRSSCFLLCEMGGVPMDSGSFQLWQFQIPSCHQGVWVGCPYVVLILLTICQGRWGGHPFTEWVT